MWFCSLNVTYTVRKDKGRRLAWWAFLSLLRIRMNESDNATIPKINEPLAAAGPIAAGAKKKGPTPSTDANDTAIVILKSLQHSEAPPNATLWSFSFSEGLYLDSKTISFSATWRLTGDFRGILGASGLWKKLPERDNAGGNLWATTIGDVSGSVSWLPNTLDPKLDVIVDFGGG